MKISVQSLKGKRIFQFEEPAQSFPMLSAMAESSTCEFVSPVRISLTLYRVNDMYRGEGSVETSVRFQCSRCLDDFVYPVYADFAFNFTSEPDSDLEPSLHGEYQIKAEQAGLVVFSDDEIDLTEPVQDQIIMVLPIQPLCRADCLGLCPQCGVNLNRETCHCEKVPFNPKFQSLAMLKKNKSNPN